MNAKEQEAWIEKCRVSGKTIREFSEENGIPYETFRTWLKRQRKRQQIKSDRKSYEEYREIVIAAKSSGKLSKQWCEENGYNYPTYCGWSKKVNRREGVEAVNKLCGYERRSGAPAGEVSNNPPLCEVRR